MIKTHSLRNLHLHGEYIYIYILLLVSILYNVKCEFIYLLLSYLYFKVDFYFQCFFFYLHMYLYNGRFRSFNEREHILYYIMRIFIFQTHNSKKCELKIKKILQKQKTSPLILEIIYI